MNKTDARVKKTHKLLLDGFMQLISEKDFEDVTVSEICKRSGVHRATFYQHFNDKFEFLNFCFENSLSEIELDDVQINTSPQNVKESFMYFIKKTFEYVQKNRLIFSIICSEKHSISLGMSFIAAVEAYCFSKISLVLPKASKESLEIFSSFYSNAFIGVIKWYVLYDGDYPLEEIYEFLERRVDELCSYYEKTYFNEN